MRQCPAPSALPKIHSCITPYLFLFKSLGLHGLEIGFLPTPCTGQNRVFHWNWKPWPPAEMSTRDSKRKNDDSKGEHGANKSSKSITEQPLKRNRVRKQLWCGCPCGDPSQMTELVEDPADFPYQCACTWCGPANEEGRRRCQVQMNIPLLRLCEDCREGTCNPQVEELVEKKQ